MREVVPDFPDEKMEAEKVEAKVMESINWSSFTNPPTNLGSTIEALCYRHPLFPPPTCVDS